MKNSTSIDIIFSYMLIVLDSIGNNMFKNFCIYLHMSQWMSVDTLPPRHQSKSFANSPTTIWNYPEHPPICLSTLKLKLNIMSFHDPPWTLEKSWKSCLETSFCISIFTKKAWKSSIKIGSNFAVAQIQAHAAPPCALLLLPLPNDPVAVVQTSETMPLWRKCHLNMSCGFTSFVERKLFCG